MFTKEDKRLMTKVDQKFFTLDLAIRISKGYIIYATYRLYRYDK